MRAKFLLSLVLALALICIFLPAAKAQGLVTVQGQVVNAKSQPIPGVSVSLLYPNGRQRSSLSITDSFGNYKIYGVPTNPQPYFIEVYWGKQLLYRQPIRVVAPMNYFIRIR